MNINIAIFCSGTGSNAKRIIEHFTAHAYINVSLLISNRADAGALHIAEDHGISTMVINKKLLYEQTDQLIEQLKKFHIHIIILAGFLWKIPNDLIDVFENKILNIHPSLLPKFGGKNMFGLHVHEAVLAAGEKTSGMSIHCVNSEYDAGKILFQATCRVEQADDAISLAARVLRLEHTYFPSVIEAYIDSFLKA